jgi:phosphohistidine phosphatase
LRSVALVGHEPDLGSLLAWLTTHGEAPFCELKKGGVCLARYEKVPAAGRATLVWVATPAMLRKLAA